MDADIFIELFNNSKFDLRKSAIEFILSDSNIRNKKLENFNVGCKNKVNLKCCFDNCSFKVCCYKSVAKNTLNTFLVDETTSNFNHAVIDEITGLITGFCTGINNISKVSINIININYYLM